VLTYRCLYEQRAAMKHPPRQLLLLLLLQAMILTTVRVSIQSN